MKLSDTIQTVDFLQRPIHLAQESQHTIERFYSLNAEILRFYAPLHFLFFPFLYILANLIHQQVILSKTIKGMFIARFNVNLPYTSWLKDVAQAEEETLLFEKPDSAFQSNVIQGRIIDSDLSSIISKPYNRNLFQVAAYSPKSLNLAFLNQILSQQEQATKRIEREGNHYTSTTPKLALSFVSTYIEARELTPCLFEVLAQQPNLMQEQIVQAKPENILGKEETSKKEKPKESLIAHKLSTHLEIKPIRLAKEKPKEETKQEPAINRFKEWQSELGMRSLPIQKTMTFLVQLEKAAANLHLSTAINEARSGGFSSVDTFQTSKPKLSLEKATNDEMLVEPEAAKVSEITPSQIELTSKLTPKSLSTVGYASALPAIICEQESPFLQVAAALSLASSLPVISAFPSPMEPVKAYAPSTIKPTTELTSPQTNILSKEVTPSLTSLIYEGSEALRSTNVALSAVPIAASIAERVITETLTQPTASLATAQPAEHQELTLPQETPKRLPTVLALAGAGSLIAYRLQHELGTLKATAQTAQSIFAPTLAKARLTLAQPSPIALSGLASEIATKLTPPTSPEGAAKPSPASLIVGSIAAVSELAAGLLLGASYRAATAQATKATLLAGSIAAMTEANAILLSVPYARATTGTSKAFTRAAARASQAATATLVASNLTAMSQIYAGASAEESTGTSALAAAKAFTQAGLTQSPSTMIETPILPRAARVPSKPLPIPPSVTKSNLESEGEEIIDDNEDLRDLERKIRKILSEQLNRCYGSSTL